MSLLEKATLITTPTAHSNGTLHSIKGGAVADFDVVRGSAATRVNAEGLIEDIRVIGDEEITNGDFSNGSTGWDLGTGWSVSDGKAVHNGAQSLIGQTNILTIGKSYKITFDLSGADSSNYARLLSSQYPNGGNYTSDGTITVYTTTNIDDLYIYGVGNISITNISVVEVIDATNIPRIDYTDGTASILLEPQSTNLLTYSEDFSDASWLKSGATATLTSEISPSGNANNVYNYVGNNSNIFTTTQASGIEYTISCYAKSNGQGKDTFTLRLGNVKSAVFTTTSKWKRYSFTHTPTTSVFSISTNALLDADILIYGAQLEALSYATSYIPTSGTIATRLADSVTGAGDATTFNDSEGVLYAEMAALANDGFTRNISISDGTYTNTVLLRYLDLANIVQAVIRVGGVFKGICQFTLSDTTENIKAAYKWKSGDFALWINGTEVATSSDTGVFSANTLNQVDFNRGDGNQDFYGKVKSVITFNTALTDAELECLTTI